MVSFHFLKPDSTSLVVISAEIGFLHLTSSGMAKEVKISWSSTSSFPCQEDGTLPDKSSVASLDLLLKVSLSCIIPCPHGEIAATRKELRLYRRRLVCIVCLSNTASHVMSAAFVCLRKSW